MGEPPADFENRQAGKCSEYSIRFGSNEGVKADYRIQEMLLQSAKMVVYRVKDTEGRDFALTRLIATKEMLGQLEGERFEVALRELKALSHPCLRQVVDGGQDEVDRQPWIVTQWHEGEVLQDRIKRTKGVAEDGALVAEHARLLIDHLRERAGAISFRAREVVFTEAAEGSPRAIFSVDILEWFREWSLGEAPGFQRNPELGLARLLSHFSLSSERPAVAHQPPQEKIAAPVAKPVQLASASSGFSPLLVVLTLFVLLGGGSWWLLKQQPKVKPALECSQIAEGEAPRKMVVEPLSESSTPYQKGSQEENALIKEAVQPRGEARREVAFSFPERPSAGEIQEVELNESEGLQENVGKWVVIRGEVKEVKDDYSWEFLSRVGLNGKLHAGQVNFSAAEKIEVVGFLRTAKELAVASIGDVVIDEGESFVLDKIFTPADQNEIRELEGERVTVKARVLAIESSTSGKTLYLRFREDNPLFGASTLKKYRLFSMAELQALVGKEVTVTGIVKLESRSNRLLVMMNRKSDLQDE